MGVEDCVRETSANESNLPVSDGVIEVPSSKIESTSGVNLSNGGGGKESDNTNGVLRMSQSVVAVDTKSSVLGIHGVDCWREDCAVDGCVVNKGGDKWEGEKVCRICHLEPDIELGDAEMIQLGCGCKGELGVAHRNCADAWFKLKGDRFCEICGKIASNVTVVIERRVAQEWHERGPADANIGANNTSQTSCWRGHPFCNFFMACLVITFVLPWFFRVNMF